MFMGCGLFTSDADVPDLSALPYSGGKTLRCPRMRSVRLGYVSSQTWQETVFAGYFPPSGKGVERAPRIRLPIGSLPP